MCIHIFLRVAFNCAAVKQSCAKFMLARRDRCKNETTLCDALVSGLSRARSIKAHTSQAEPFSSQDAFSARVCAANRRTAN